LAPSWRARSATAEGAEVDVRFLLGIGNTVQ